MSTLLHVSASPRAERSESLALARLFLDTYAEQNPDVTVEEWDLWDGTLPEFGQAAVEGKMNTFAGIALEGPSAAAWRQVTATFERFAAADAYLFSVPMWNAGVPYKLKQLIDVVSQPGLVFGFDPGAGYTGLLTGRKAAVLYTSAIYGPGRGPAFGSDFQAPFFRDWLAWAGVEDVREVSFGPNIAAVDVEGGRRFAREETARLAKEF
ncbi:MAG: NAD(P)H-dependent oxidoreductase [Sporichthyaceae bacterium]